jgi:hypothetical protein
MALQAHPQIHCCGTRLCNRDYSVGSVVGPLLTHSAEEAVFEDLLDVGDRCPNLVSVEQSSSCPMLEGGVTAGVRPSEFASSW